MALTPLDFPASPTLNQTYPNPVVTGQPTYKWDGSVWLAFDEETPGPESPDRYIKKNYIINGAMQISQENGITQASTNGYYPVDQFFLGSSGTSGAAAIGMNMSRTPAGSPSRIRVTVTTADAAVASGDIVWINQNIEGQRVSDLQLGTANAKTFTIQFGVRAPAGTYSVVALNAPGSRNYVAEYVIAAGENNTEVVKSVTIPGDVTGTWAVDSTTGLTIRWGLMAGTTWQQAAGAWGTTNAIGSPNQFNLLGTINNTFDLFDVSLTEGTVAPPFQVPDYPSELALCQRYYYLSRAPAANMSFAVGLCFSTTQILYDLKFPVPMRSGPTFTYSAIGDFQCLIAGVGLSPSNVVITQPNTLGARLDAAVTGATAGHASVLNSVNANAAIKLSARL